jgi:hypothetical protein
MYATLTLPDATIPYSPSELAPVVGTSTGVVLLAASCRPPVDVVPAVTVLPPR